MTTLEWSQALELDLPAMDATHREFIDLLAALEAAPEDQLLPVWAELVAHTDGHFGQEDRWMQDTHFASSNCHTTQHMVVLQVLREVETRARAGDTGQIRQLAHELAVWFAQHAQSMDAALALHLRGVGYDVATGVVAMPQRLPAQPVQGCGSVGCSPPAESRDSHEPQDAAQPSREPHESTTA